MYAESSIYDQFVVTVAQKFEEFTTKLGDPFDEATEGGPLVGHLPEWLADEC